MFSLPAVLALTFPDSSSESEDESEIEKLKFVHQKIDKSYHIIFSSPLNNGTLISKT